MLQLIQLLLPILNKLIPDSEKRIEAQNEIIKMASENEGKIFDAMKEVMAADSNSDSAYTRAARPTVVYWSLGLTTMIVVLAPFGLDSAILLSLSKIPSDLWLLITTSIGAFTLGRSGEKIIKTYKNK